VLSFSLLSRAVSCGWL